jgi:hypothetical protein
MRFTEKPPSLAQYDRQQAEVDRRVTAVASEINDTSTREAHRQQRNVMSAARLGGLTNAVKVKTGRGRDKAGQPNAYGVIYIENGDESRAGRALAIYTKGGTINPIRSPWLWYQTDVLKRTAKVPGDNRRSRLTPERYRQMGNPLGPLEFARINPRLAKLYVEVADINIATGRATKPGKRRSRTKVRTKRVTVFFGIKNTSRAMRYDPQQTVRQAHGEIPPAIARRMVDAFKK